MKKLHLFSQAYFLIFAMLVVTSCNGQTNSNAENSDKNIDQIKIDKIDEIINLYSENAGFNGSVLIAHNGKVIYKKGFGLANMEWNIPNETDTKFRIASVTKPFTAMLIMQLVAEKKLDLHKPITTYLTDYPKENGSKITVHNLLTHSSGLLRDVDAEQKQFHSPKQLVHCVKSYLYFSLAEFTSEYRLFNFLRASSWVNCQSILTPFWVRSLKKCNTSDSKTFIHGIRRSRQSLESAENSISIMFNHEALFGVKTNSILSVSHAAVPASNCS